MTPVEPNTTLGEEPATDSPELATLRQRLRGRVLDGLLQLVAGVTVATIAGELFGWIPSQHYAQLLGAGTVGIIPVAIYNWRLLTLTGQTIGKRAVGSRVIRLDGSRADFVSVVLLRSWAVSFAAGFIPGLGLIDAALIFRPDRRCLHDQLAGTKVVQVPGAVADDVTRGEKITNAIIARSQRRAP